jgi:hypothetical protein
VLAHDARRQSLQLALVSGPRQRRMAHVVVDVEVVIVDPYRVVLDRHVRQPLSVAGDEMQARHHVGADAIDVDAAIGEAERPGLVHRRTGHVHGGVRSLEEEERVVEEAQAVVGVAHHG